MRIAGLYDLDPRLLSGDQLAFAKELADPDRIKHAEANMGMSQLESVRSAHCAGKVPRELRKPEFRKSRPARSESRKERKRDG
jgi:hypothetical protein